MKRIFAKGLAMLMLLTLVAIPARGEKSAEAATKAPIMDVTGGIENFKMLTKKGMVQKEGKTVTLTLKNVKKSNLKSVTYYMEDPRVATVTDKKITKKRIGCKIKIKKIGRTVLMTRITLKKKQAGHKIWWLNINVTGVKVMSKKDLAAFPKKYIEASSRSALLDKYGNYAIHGKQYGGSEKLSVDIDYYYSKDDLYSAGRFHDTNEESLTYIDLTNPNANTGYQVYRGETPFAGYYFVSDDLLVPNALNYPAPSDPDEVRHTLETMDPDFLYSDGLNYYYSDVSNSKSEFWTRSEIVCDVKTNEIIATDAYYKNDKGKEFLGVSFDVETDIEMPIMYDTLKIQYMADAKKKVKVEFIIDPGKAEERRITNEIPAGAPVKLSPLDGYEEFLDAEGKTPLPDDFDTDSDLTVYYIKTQDASSEQAAS